MKVLVVAQSWVGDVVMTSSMLYQIKKIYPDATIDFLVSDWAMDLASRIDVIDTVIKNPFAHGQLRLSDRFRFARNLSHAKYDVAYIVPNSYKAGLIPFWAKIKSRVGFVGEFRYGLVNKSYKLDPLYLPLMIDRLNYLVTGHKVETSQKPVLSVDKTNQLKLLNKFNLTNSARLIAICPAAEYGPSKRWGADKYADLSVQLIHSGYTVLIMGSHKDTDISTNITTLANSNPQLIDLCGKTNLVDVVDILAACQYVVSNDSGLMHVAGAVGVNVVAIFGSSSPNYTPPLSSKAKIIQNPTSCSPCFKRECKFGHYDCLQSISVTQVMREINLLNQ